MSAAQRAVSPRRAAAPDPQRRRAGTNVLIRARAVFLACKFGEKQERRKRFWHAHKQLSDPPRARQLFSEELIAEDVDLGSRVHALGFKSVFLDEVLARGEVLPPLPRPPSPSSPPERMRSPHV